MTTNKRLSRYLFEFSESQSNKKSPDHKTTEALTRINQLTPVN
jgi:hypothetical protein